jgi:hypothetical protein
MKKDATFIYEWSVTDIPKPEESISIFTTIRSMRARP